MTVFISKAESELEEIPHYLNSQNIKGFLNRSFVSSLYHFK